MFVSRAACMLMLVPCLAWAQLSGTPQNTNTDNCQCSPECEVVMSSSECRGRLVVREDCPCCKVCARQESDPCHHPAQPCDKEFGLVCSPEGVCKAEISCSNDAECPNDRFCLGDVCADPCPILTPCQGNLKGGQCVTREHRPLCQCPPGTLANSEASVCIPLNSTESDDDNSTREDQPATEPSSKVEGKVGVGSLKVRQVNHNSSTVILPSSKGGELYYKGEGSTEWLQKMVSAGEDSLMLKELMPGTQYTLKWSGAFGGSAKVTIDTQGGCIAEGPVSYGIGEEWVEGCQRRCSCRPEGKVDCQHRCIFSAGDIKDPQCRERAAPEDPECCVVYDCIPGGESDTSSSPNQDSAGQPKLLVTEKTHNSVTLAWDDFRARTYEGGYVAEYREEAAGSSSSTTTTSSGPPQQPWKRKEVTTGETPPKITVEGLMPNTLYEVRVSIYDDVEEGRLGEATETINFRTEAGCLYGNSSHAVGEFYKGCEERCVCLATSAVRCFERCTLPFIRAGSFKGDPFCREQPDESDECCAIVQCTTNRRAYTPCTNIVCGPNAGCISSATKELSLSDIDSDRAPGYCRCNKGFTGDASDLAAGCVSDPSAGKKEGSCTFKNSTYRPGDVFFDKCDYRCSCNNNTEIECEPRCEFPKEGESNLETGCKYVPDPTDACCKLRVCNSTSTTGTHDPSLPTDGCTQGNVTYARNQKFYNGCETQCICMGFGDVSCFPRCPPLKVVSERPKRCETLPDPLDPCCSITVCDQPTPDVMKANITEMQNEMMKNMTVEEKEMMAKEMMNMTDSEKEMMLNEMMNVEKAKEEAMNVTLMEKPSNQTDPHVHTHEDGTTHSHAHDGPHTHDDDPHMHTHEDGTTHSHTHDDPHMHTHEDGTMHSHAHDDNHTHDNDPHFHVHEDGTAHSHTHDDPHNHTNMDDPHMHTHEDGTTHSHTHDGPHNHTDMKDPHMHTHEDGTTHSHTHDGPHNHTDMNDPHMHTHEDGTTHSHTHDGPHNHTDMNDPHMHTHEDGTTHSHPHDNLHTHTDDMVNKTNSNTHTHADGTTHSHDHDMHTHDHTHDNDTTHSHTHDHMMPNEHTHEDGTTHSHPHVGPHNHTDMEDPHMHTHEDGTTHSHPHDGPHSHDNDPNFHVHEDGTAHSHPHDGPHTHDDDPHFHVHADGTSHSHNHDNDPHFHVHEDGTAHNHPHDGPHNLDNDPHFHVHEDGRSHSHPHDDPHNHTDMDDPHMHTHEDGTTHSHPQKVNMKHTHLNMVPEKKNRAEDLGTHDLHILDLTPLNSTAIRIKLGVSNPVMQQIRASDDQHFLVLYSPDSLTWSEKEIPISDIKVENYKEVTLYLSELQPSTPYQFRVAFQDYVSSTSKTRLMDSSPDADGELMVDPSGMCHHNGSYYKAGQEFYEGCAHSCVCTEDLEVECIAIECPVTFGLELIDPNCFEWDLDPDYIPTPPKCCAQVKCITTYACKYMGQNFNNYDEIPRELTGCSQVCSCNFGNVTCRSLCEEIPSIPPPHLDCPPQDAILITLPGEPCCRSWQCPTHSAGSTSAIFPLPPVSVLSGTPTSGFLPIAPPYFGSGDGLPEPRIIPMDSRTLRLSFSTPPYYQGLPGELLLRYTNQPSQEPDPSNWSKEVIVPMGSLIGHSEWDHVLSNLSPGSKYTLQTVITVQGTDPVVSPFVSFTTMEEPTTPSTTTPLPRLDIDAELYASEITKRSAKVSWRGFSEYELQYIDGVQIKYTEKDKLIPRFSQLFHRDNNQMDIRDLLPGHSYTVDLVFITLANQTTPVTNTRPITFSTLPEEDPYEFDIEVRAGKVSSQTAELFYSGVPEPEEKYVNVYRAVYLREKEGVDAQVFKIPKTGHDRKIFLDDLKPDIEYEVWLEAFLLNGRKKQSNVITITTRAGVLPKPERSEVDPSLRAAGGGGTNYYPALVAVAIIAAIACVAFLGLLVILLRNKSQAKAHINSTRNNAAYDNPSYKVGDNAYDMEMNGLKNTTTTSGNGATHAPEEP